MSVYVVVSKHELSLGADGRCLLEHKTTLIFQRHSYENNPTLISDFNASAVLVFLGYGILQAKLRPCNSPVYLVQK